MPIQIKGGKKVQRNSPCPCGSKLKYKKCHGDVIKQQKCSEIANQLMTQLIKQEQVKLIQGQQKRECKVCRHTGEVDGLFCRCQFLTDKAYDVYITAVHDEVEPEGKIII